MGSSGYNIWLNFVKCEKGLRVTVKALAIYPTILHTKFLFRRFLILLRYVKL